MANSIIINISGLSLSASTSAIVQPGLPNNDSKTPVSLYMIVRILKWFGISFGGFYLKKKVLRKSQLYLLNC